MKLAPTAIPRPRSNGQPDGHLRDRGNAVQSHHLELRVWPHQPLGTMAVPQKLEVSPAILTACGGNLAPAVTRRRSRAKLHTNWPPVKAGAPNSR